MLQSWHMHFPWKARSPAIFGLDSWRLSISHELMHIWLVTADADTGTAEATRGHPVNMPSKHGRHQKFHELLVKNVNSTFGSKSWRYPWKELLGDEAPALWHLVGHPPQVTHFNKNWGIKCQSHDRRCSLFHDGKANSLRKGSQPSWPMFQQDHHVIHKRIAGTSSRRPSKISQSQTTVFVGQWMEWDSLPPCCKIFVHSNTLE